MTVFTCFAGVGGHFNHQVNNNNNNNSAGVI